MRTCSRCRANRVDWLRLAEATVRNPDIAVVVHVPRGLGSILFQRSSAQAHIGPKRAAKVTRSAMDDRGLLRKRGTRRMGDLGKPIIAIKPKVVIVMVAREHMHAI